MREALASWLMLMVVVVPNVKAQSNYNQQILSRNYTDESVQERAHVNGTVVELGTLSDTILLNRTQAYLNCSAGFMNVALTFEQPFYGIIYAEDDRNSACRVEGEGKDKIEIDVPLKGCGTNQGPVRVFQNDIFVRFHRDLEIDGDEKITILCRYPKPIIQVPLIPLPVVLPDTPLVADHPIREFEILLIICAIVFLALLLLGIGCSYYCLKKRNIRVIRRRPLSTIGSEVTRVSDPPSMFAGLKIPRAHAMDTSGSEEMTESVHTDYGSDVTSIATVEEYQSAYSDLGGELDESIVYPDIIEPPLPAFDIKTRMKKYAKSLTPMSSRASSVTEDAMLAAQEQYLTTILERTETNTMETLERIRKSKAEMGPPPVHARLRVQHRAPSVAGSDSETSQYSHDQLGGTDVELTEDELAPVMLDRPIRHALTVQSDTLKSARLVENVQVRESEYITRQEELIRQRASNIQKNQTGFDVTVRTTDGRGGQIYSDDDTASMSEYTNQDPIEPVYLKRGAEYSRDDMYSRQDISHTAYMQDTTHQSAARHTSKFDVLIRVLDAAPPGGSASASDKDDLTSVFSEDDRQKWRDIVTYDTEFRTMIESARSTQEVTHALSQIRYVSKYEKVFQPHQWDVIVRVLQAPSISNKSVSSKSTRSTSKSANEFDLRSMTETTVDFGAMRSDFESGSSVSGRSGRVSQYTSGARSAQDRSETEFTEYQSYMYAESHAASSNMRSESRPSLGGQFASDTEHF